VTCRNANVYPGPYNPPFPAQNRLESLSHKKGPGCGSNRGPNQARCHEPKYAISGQAASSTSLRGQRFPYGYKLPPGHGREPASPGQKPARVSNPLNGR